MGLFNAMLGNASDVDTNEIAEEYEPILAEGETIEAAFKMVRDLYIFTSKRLILVDKQGMTGRKVEYRSIPYRAVTQFTVENAGTFDADSEMKIWISGQAEPLTRELKRGANVEAIQKALASIL